MMSAKKENTNDDVCWKIFPGCSCVKKILIKYGYDNVNSLVCINDETLNNLEIEMNKHPEIIKEINCKHSEIYSKQDKFQFLLGHRCLVLKWCENLKEEAIKKRSSETFQLNNPEFSPILIQLIRSAIENHTKSPNIRRFSDLLMKFSIYLYIAAGKACYEVLSENLHLPKANTIAKHIHADKETIVEGELRCKELSEHLDRTNSPRTVFLSEDGTGVICKVVYDSRTNQLVGIVMPLDSTTGIPKQFSFAATTEEEIRKFMQLAHSTHVYVVIAQPLRKNAPSFVLQIYGVNNQFQAIDVLKRWKHTVSELKKLNIDVIGFSSDGDPKLLKSMLNITIFDIDWTTELKSRSLLQPICIQDTIHIGTKMRNRLLNPSNTLQLGNFVATTIHLKILLNTVGKDTHGLVQSDIYPNDRQNYQSLEKIMHDRVLNSLLSSVPDCQGTVAYLKLCKQLTSSFIDEDLDPIERVYRMWCGTYFLRCWRRWVNESKTHTLTYNFISSNAYRCVEINAHGLINLIQKLRDEPNLGARMFLPSYFASQPCESFFRLARSLGTQNYTKINFSIYELLHLTAKVELMNRIAFSTPDIEFPRIKSKLEPQTSAKTSHNLPSDEVIMNTLKRAMEDALKLAGELGMETVEDQIKKCADNFDDSLVDEILEHEKEEDDTGDDETGENVENVRENEMYFHRNVEIIEEDGTVKTIRKSTLVWILTKFIGELSKERLKRVQGPMVDPEAGPSSKRAKLIPNNNLTFKTNRLEIGDWAVFKNSSGSFEESKLNCYLITFITGFRIVKSKNIRTKYKLNYVPIGNNIDAKTLKKIRLELGSDFNDEQIEVLAVFYECKKNGALLPKENVSTNVSGSLPLRDYFATMKNPITKLTDSSSLIYFLPGEYSEFSNNLLEKTP